MTSASHKEWDSERSEPWGSSRDAVAERVFERAGASEPR
jgi:hypothetical protein